MAQWDDAKYAQLADLLGTLEFLVRDSGEAQPANQIKRLIGLHFLTARITPPEIAADQNDYAPAGLMTASALRLSTDASRNITGLIGGIKDRMLAIINVGANDIVLKNENAGSAAANRFGLDADLTLAAKQACIIWYDYDASRWRCIAKTSAVAVGASTGTPGGRLTLTSGAPVTTADVAASTNVYYTPHIHNQITLWTGAAWQTIEFTEKTLALGAVTAALPYDVFGHLSAGELVLEKLAWASATARATAISLQDGRYCKTGDKTRLYLGTFYTIDTTQTADSATKRFLWNMYNRRARLLHYTTADNYWTYAIATWRQANANAANKVQIVIGLLEDEISLSLVCSCVPSGAVEGFAGISEDVTNAPHANGHYQGGGDVANGWIPFTSTLDTFPNSIGYHYYAWVEKASGATITFYGSGTNIAGGLNGRVLA
jgi:hypothetical protein